jgi:stage V sporulation protein G
MSEQNKTEETKQEVAQNIVTKVQVFPFTEGANLGHMKGVAVIEVFGALVIRGLRIMEGSEEGKYFVNFPFDPFYKGEDFRTIVTPVNENVKQAINDAVIGKYQEYLNSPSA